MNIKSTNILTLVVLGLVLACGKTTDSNTPDSTAKASEIEIIDNEKLVSGPIDVDLVEKSILFTPNGTERLELVGKRQNDISTAEATTFTDTTSTSISFTTFFLGGEEQFVDATYSLKNNYANGIDLDIYLNEAKDIAKLKAKLEASFNNKFSKSEIKEGALLWKNKGYMLRLSDVSFKNSLGLKITYFAQDAAQL
jgi:hypothetical protein